MKSWIPIFLFFQLQDKNKQKMHHHHKPPHTHSKGRLIKPLGPYISASQQMTTQKCVSSIAHAEYGTEFTFYSFKKKIKIWSLISHIHNSKVIPKEHQMSKELWPTASTVPCPGPLLLFYFCLVLIATFTSQHSLPMLYNVWQKMWFLADFARG